jgi:hypothetical protein
MTLKVIEAEGNVEECFHAKATRTVSHALGREAG